MRDLALDEMLECGRDGGRGNLLGVQPHLIPADYASAETLTERLGGYLAAARERGWLGPHSIAVFPEYAGAWLLAEGERPAVYRAATVSAALTPLALARPLAFARQLLAARERDRLTAAVFRLKAARTARLYQQVFSTLAREFAVTLVAGSLVLPAPRVEAGEMRVDSGPLYNTSALFHPDGSLDPRLTRKVHPIASELAFAARAPLADLPVYATPAGRLGVLICADSWFPEPYQRLAEQDVELLAVPSLITGNGVWQQPWRGYDTGDPPAGVGPADPGRLTEAQAWRKYALSARMASCGARAGVNAFLHGSLWDLGSDSGRTLALGPGGLVECTTPRAALVNCWL